MARRRTAKAHPTGWLIAERWLRGKAFSMSSGSSFVIKVDVQAQETFLLTCEHVVRGELSPGDGLRVRMMLPVGVGEFPASIIHMNTQIDVAILRVPGLTAAASLRFSPEDPIAGEGIAAVGYCDPDDLFAESSYSKIPAINPGCVRGTDMLYTYKRIPLYHALLSCIGMEGMSGGPILSKRGVVGMTASGDVGCTDAVHPRTILGC